MRSAVSVIAGKESRDIYRNKAFVAVLVLLCLVSMVAVVLGSVQVHHQVEIYRKTAEFLKSMGRTDLPPMPSLNPIAVSKNYVNYIAMLGALLAMILGNYAMSKEGKNGTLRLILTRPVFRDQVINGKLLGNVLVLVSILGGISIATLALIRFVGGVALTGPEVVKTLLFFGMSLLYLLFFFILAMWLAIKLPRKNNALLVAMIVWLVFAFIVPQVGDTMDLDNQLPGGFFAQMGMTKTQEKQVLAHFHWYEKVRDGIEEMSPTKHYERISFALLGVKPEFIDNTPLEIVKLKWLNVVGLTVPSLVLVMLSYVEFLRKA